MCVYSVYMTFVSTEIKHFDAKINEAQALWDLSVSRNSWSKLEKLSASMSVYRDLRFLLSMTKGLDVRLVLLDALVQATKELATKPITTFIRLYIVELTRLLQRYQWHEDHQGDIGR